MLKGKVWVSECQGASAACKELRLTPDGNDMAVAVKIVPPHPLQDVAEEVLLLQVCPHECGFGKSP